MAVFTCVMKREFFRLAEMQKKPSQVDGAIEDELETELSFSICLFLSIYLFSRGHIWIISS